MPEIMSAIFRKKSKSQLATREPENATSRASAASAPPVPSLPIPPTPSTPTDADEPTSAHEDESIPDTRVLSQLGVCASGVTTRIVEDTLRPATPTALGYPRRTASEMSTASSVLATPTYPSEVAWNEESITDDTVSEVSVEPEVDVSQTRVEASSEEGAPFPANTSAEVPAWATSYQSDLFVSRNDEYDMSQLLAALGEDIKKDEQASVSPFGFETIGRGKDAVSFKDRPELEAEDFYVPTFATEHTRTTPSEFRKHQPGSRFGSLQDHLRTNGSRQGGVAPGQTRPMRSSPEPR